ncbi:hypothetical protein [Leptolyngbya sp. FACHB-711]|uniref:hypothetical protein n=1 Tax=unclassified Leptolyngbya TaxID=2650499 RepID=UPI001681DBD3|nr:hypothetical protein [Leptolyngbya sp. FACHB-711]MBD1852358.1 hypothetical protein [Cyanobacteria bacterium FACHB-502]MBD2025646.1 hypothetical protein [Leptolyngbya sp. FACHB-711]
MNTKTKLALSAQTIVLAAIAWAVLALLFFLLFSVSPSGEGRPEWYGVITYVFESLAFLAAGLFCFRNWRSPQIVSGRTVWLAIGLGMLTYFIGNLILGYWEIGLGKSPEVSPGDLFYILTYLFLGWGMLRAVLTRRLNLTPIQWGILAAITIVGITIAASFAPSSTTAAEWSAPGSAEQLVAAAPSPTNASPTPTVDTFPAIPNPASPEVADVPAWAIAMESQLEPLAGIISWLYIIGDVILVVMATMLLLAFWGGRFSLSWRCIAAAALCFYIADIWFNYAVTYIPGYETGALPEVFWVFSGCLFAIGAALEYDLSTRRQTRRRRS